ENVIVSGTLDEDQIDAIGGKTLRPHFVNYMDGEGEMHICTDFTVLTGDETTLDAGWYVADSDLAYDHTLTLNGDVTLILCDGKTMTVNPDSGNSIIGAWNYTLTVYGQTLDSETAGTLYVTNNVESKEAIDLSTYTQHSGNVVVSDSNDQAIHASFTLNGGTVNATSKQQCIWGNVIINGGIVNANNTGSGEAIYNDGNIIINGGTVNATATGTGGDGIYVNGNVTINGGTVNATGIYNGIHAQFDLILGWANANDHILVSSYEASEGTVSVKSGQAFYYIDDYSGEPVIISGTLDEEQIEAIGGKTLFPYAPVAYIDENGVEQYCISYTVVTDNLNFGDLPDGWYVVSDSITINNRNVTSDNAHLILCDGASMNISDGTGAALWVSDSLTLYGQSEGTGSLTAISNNNYGIIASNMTVNGGTVTATGTSYGIFADHNLTINGGTVNATGNDSGIYNGDASGYVTINGGTVTTNKIFSPTVTLGWSDTNDSITVGSFAYSGTPTVSVKSGQAFCYIGESGETVVISGTLNEAQIEAIGGKTLRPYVIARTVAGFGQGNGGWVLIASPFSETNPLNVTGMLSGSHDLYAFVPNPSDDLEWRNYATDTFNLEAGKGYLYANADTVTLTFNGTHIAATEPVEVPLTYDADDDRRCWNLVGNPFPFAAYLDREYYVLDADGTGIDPEPIPATTPVPPCTAVFVKAVGVNDRAVFSVTAP
ncbi:MAG: carbohydrate-binding domain-containing protein, partial [Bacteroidales bacterium]|nr:carbohydrate-binding domain-containing protein [Bacteroidales bacterium]